jgi:hypothetical protein
MSRHTPGPWHVAYKDDNGQVVVKGEHIEIATCWHHCVGALEKEMYANADLIAAAPDLLKALKSLVEGLDRTWWSSWQTTAHFDPPLEEARALLAKITGESGD